VTVTQPVQAKTLAASIVTVTPLALQAIRFAGLFFLTWAGGWVYIGFNGKNEFKNSI